MSIARVIKLCEFDDDDDGGSLEFFERAFAKQSSPLTGISAAPPAPEAKTFIRSSALPTQLAEGVEQVFADVLGGGEFVFVTIHQDVLNLRRRLRNKNLPAPRLGKRLADLITAGCPVELAYEDILKKFFACLERELQCYVRSVRVYENDGKPYRDGAPLTHVHMCIPLPEGRSYYRFISQFSRLYDSLIYPVPMPIDESKKLVTDERTLEDLKRQPREIQGTRNLSFVPGRIDGDKPHPEYMVKQIVSEPVRLSRLHTSMRAKDMKGGKFE